MTNPSTPWRVAVKFGPDGEENYAWVVADDGTLIGTFKTHHAHTVANAVNAYDKQRALIGHMVSVMASLAAAISLLERSPKKAAPSNKMFDQMLDDYRNALEAARAAIAAAKEQSA